MLALLVPVILELLSVYKIERQRMIDRGETISADEDLTDAKLIDASRMEFEALRNEAAEMRARVRAQAG